MKKQTTYLGKIPVCVFYIIALAALLFLEGAVANCQNPIGQWKILEQQIIRYDSAGQQISEVVKKFNNGWITFNPDGSGNSTRMGLYWTEGYDFEWYTGKDSLLFIMRSPQNIECYQIHMSFTPKKIILKMRSEVIGNRRWIYTCRKRI